MEDKKYIKFDIPEWVNWLARESNGDLYGYRNKPNKGVATWCIGQVNVGQINCYLVSDDPNHYPQVKWEDEEPHFYRNGGTFCDVDIDVLIDAYGKIEQSDDEDCVEMNPEPITEPDMIQNEAPDMVNTPPHYKQYSFEPIDIITEVVKEYPPEIGFHIGTVLKYLFRSPFKGKQQEDLSKAEYYLQRANKELEESE